MDLFHYCNNKHKRHMINLKVDICIWDFNYYHIFVFEAPIDDIFPLLELNLVKIIHFLV